MKPLLLSFLIAPLFLSQGVSAAEKNKSLVFMAVDKTNLIAELRTWTEDQSKSEVLSRFPIAIGKEKGDKLKVGDNRTPEGIYFTQTHIDPTQIPAEKYGPKAVPLDFPNPFDLFQNKTGYGIWLHGAGNDDRMAEATVTEGCVAFYNRDIKKLSSWLVPYQAAVVISRDLANINRSEDAQIIKARTESWLASWASKNIDAYADFYDSDFHLDGRNKEQFKDFKKSLFNKYTSMDVKAYGIRVLTHEKYAVAAMNQDFTGNNSFVSNGRKVLYWVKNKEGEWKILRETFGDRRFEPFAWTQQDLKLLTSTNPAGDRSLGEQRAPQRGTTKKL
jgi:murein L,D-transpeptidase YafK